MRLARGIKVKEHPRAEEARGRVPEIIDSVPPEDLVTAIKRAPSLRGMILGYIAEEMFEKHILQNSDKIEDVRKFDDHDRQHNKSDRDFVFSGRQYSVQLKSVQTNSISWRTDLGCLTATVQNDGSDRRPVLLPNSKTVETTNYKKGDYDILAVPLFPFTGKWDFAYKRNRDCRLTVSKKYDEETRQYLLATTEEISYPLREGWHSDLLSLCDETIGKRIN